MKIMFLFSVLFTLLWSDSILVSIPCEQLQQYNQSCKTTPNEYFLKQQFKNYQGNVTVDYVEGNDFNVTTDSAGFITAKIDPNTSFYLVTNGYKSEKLKLYITSSGAESWRYFYLGTNRWRTYKKEPIIIEITTYPKIKHIGDQGIPIHLTNRIVDLNGTSVTGIEVKLLGDAGWEYITLTDDNGIFKFDVTDRNEFKLYAWNVTMWAEYTHKLSINIYNNFFEKDRNDKWQVVKPSEWHTIKLQL